MADDDEAHEDADRPPEEIGDKVAKRDAVFAVDGALGLNEGVVVQKGGERNLLAVGLGPPRLLGASAAGLSGRL